MTEQKFRVERVNDPYTTYAFSWALYNEAGEKLANKKSDSAWYLRYKLGSIARAYTPRGHRTVIEWPT